eukprot:542969_1
MTNIIKTKEEKSMQIAIPLVLGKKNHQMKLGKPYYEQTKDLVILIEWKPSDDTHPDAWNMFYGLIQRQWSIQFTGRTRFLIEHFQRRKIVRKRDHPVSAEQVGNTAIANAVYISTSKWVLKLDDVKWKQESKGLCFMLPCIPGCCMLYEAFQLLVNLQWWSVTKKKK